MKIGKTNRAATLVVAASDSLIKTGADFICDGVNDHIEIQAALDLLPATGGKVILLDGTFSVGASINLDSYQVLVGQGRSTIITTSVANTDIIKATGALGTEKIGILISDLVVDGTAGGVANDKGIQFTAVNQSEITRCYIFNNAEEGILLTGSAYNVVSACIFINNVWGDIYIVDGAGPTLAYHNTITGCASLGGTSYSFCDAESYYNTVVGNMIVSPTGYGIYLAGRCSAVGNVVKSSGGDGIRGNGDEITITGNIVSECNIGIGIYGFQGVVSSNVCRANVTDGIQGAEDIAIIGNWCYHNGQHGINAVGGYNCIISGNICYANSQEADNTYDGIYMNNQDQATIVGNRCYLGADANKQRYGINLSASTCERCLLSANYLYEGGSTGALNDLGTLTNVEDNNYGITIDQIKHFRRVKNTSGSAMALGDVVSLKAVAAGNEVTDPAAIGERQVYGMAAEAIGSDAWGLIQTKGKTTSLKATNTGGGNIAIGDFLITEAGIRARKNAAATDPIFAWALEACAADVTIDAFIMSPWD